MPDANQILENLNDKQIEAVKYYEGPLLIAAGAGSGKTRVITNRIAYGINEGLMRPKEILGVTFTNKAAEEMRKRVAELTQLSSHSILIRTFHSACASILREKGEAIDIPQNFSIYDQDDQLKLLNSIIKGLPNIEKRFTSSVILRKISRAKNDALLPEDIRNNPLADESDLMLSEIYSIYEKKLSRAGALDFGDLIFKTVILFRSRKDILEEFRDRFRFVLVDEYQDTNKAQYFFIKELTEKHRNICVVGDDDQSIYKWRGADISNILNFEKDFPDVKIIKLEQNYRSSPEILELAASVISNNFDRMKKTLWSDNPSGTKASLLESQDDREEASFIIRQILEIFDSGENYEEIAILYRTNWQSRVIEATLFKNSIPYILIGGVRFYQRKEIRDVLSYLRLLVNPQDIMAFSRAISVPRRGIGKKSLEKILDYSQNKGLSIIDSLDPIIKNKVHKGKISHKLKEFSALFNELKNLKDPFQTVHTVIEKSGLLVEYAEEQERKENLYGFASGVREYIDDSPGSTLNSFLQEVTLLGDIDKTASDTRGVKLMTIHNAKGLEFDNVFITGLEDGLFPHFLSTESGGEVEEERRLFYVALTRARKRVYLSAAKQRMAYGQIRIQSLSRFISEIPQDLLIQNKPQYQSDYTIRPNSFTAPASQTEQVHSVFEAGDKVIHPQYGEGIISKRIGQDGMKQIHVKFKERTCLFIEKFSNLKKLE